MRAAIRVPILLSPLNLFPRPQSATPSVLSVDLMGQ